MRGFLRGRSHNMTLEEKQRKLDELRKAWKEAKTSTDRKVIEIRANLLKRSISTLV